MSHIVAERADAIIALRPITELEQLTAVSGIGPGRLTDIIAQGVEL